MLKILANEITVLLTLLEGECPQCGEGTKILHRVSFPVNKYGFCPLSANKLPANHVQVLKQMFVNLWGEMEIFEGRNSYTKY